MLCRCDTISYDNVWFECFSSHSPLKLIENASDIIMIAQWGQEFTFQIFFKKALQ